MRGCLCLFRAALTRFSCLSPSTLSWADVHYLAQPCADYMVAAAETVHTIHRDEDPGDILVFMPGQDEIDRTCQLIMEGYGAVLAGEVNTLSPSHAWGVWCVRHERSGLMVVPMYAGLPIDDQMKVCHRAGYRLCV